MFFHVSKIITFLIDPLFAILVLLFVFIIRGTRRWKSRLIFLMIFAALYLGTTGLVANRLMFSLEHLVPPSAAGPKYDAVIVLSGMTGIQKQDTRQIEFSGAVDRILIGMQLLRENRAERMIISGGDGSLTQRQRPEAELLRDFAIQWGIEPMRIFIDTTSRNTYENAVRTADMAKGLKLGRSLLITSAFHMFRAWGCFQKAGLSVDGLPVDVLAEVEFTDVRKRLPASGSLEKTNQVIHEVVGIFVYRLTGRADYSFSQ